MTNIGQRNPPERHEVYSALMTALNYQVCCQMAAGGWVRGCSLGWTRLLMVTYKFKGCGGHGS
jgi:hypothetical protein